MNDPLRQRTQEWEEKRLAAMIWWLMLWYASDAGKLELPSEQEWLSCELVATIAEETTGEKFRYSWKHNESGRVKMQQWNAWPEYLNRVMESSSRCLPYSLEPDHPRCLVMNLLKRFAKYRFVHEHNEKRYESNLSLFHKESALVMKECSRFKPGREMYHEAIEYVDEQQKYCGFDRGELLLWLSKMSLLIMRPCINRDIQFIRAHYDW